jgi:hypothetical protein
VTITLVNLDSTLFPGVPSSVLAHQGFLDEHSKTATIILEEVNQLLESTGATSITCVSAFFRAMSLFYLPLPSALKVGHSLGGALAQLDSLFFTLNLPSSITISATTYGTPRVGNPAYAAYFDFQVCLITCDSCSCFDLPVSRSQISSESTMN